MRRFTLIRQEDPLGLSGTGQIAEGVEASTGKVIVFWLTAVQSVVVYESLAEMQSIVCHGGMTAVVWLDAPVVEMAPR